jgi:hypothetical protein
VEGAQACDFPLTIPDLGSGTMMLAHAHGRRQGSTVGDLRARDGQNPALLQGGVEAAMKDDVAVKKA